VSDFLKINVDEHEDADVQQALPVADVGEVLRAHRLKRNLSQDEVARELRMDVRQLDALENNRFEVFSGPVFVQGYLRNYAKLLDLDPAPIINEFNKVSEIKTPEIVAIKKVMTSAGGGSQIPLSKFTPVILGIVTLVLVIWLGDNLYSFIKEVGKTSEVAETENGMTEIDVLNRFQEAQDRLSTGLDVESSSVLTITNRPRPEASALSNSDELDSADQIEVETVQPEEPAVAVVEAVKVRAIFRFKEDSWIEVLDVNDTRLLARIGTAGAEKAVEGVPPLRVVLGNAQGVEVEFEGEPYRVRISNNSQVARFKLGQAD